jgi:hypothetical protein
LFSFLLCLLAHEYGRRSDLCCGYPVPASRPVSLCDANHSLNDVKRRQSRWHYVLHFALAFFLVDGFLDFLGFALSSGVEIAKYTVAQLLRKVERV